MYVMYGEKRGLYKVQYYLQFRASIGDLRTYPQQIGEGINILGAAHYCYNVSGLIKFYDMHISHS